MHTEKWFGLRLLAIRGQIFDSDNLYPTNRMPAIYFPVLILSSVGINNGLKGHRLHYTGFLCYTAQLKIKEFKWKQGELLRAAKLHFFCLRQILLCWSVVLCKQITKFSLVGVIFFFCGKVQLRFYYYYKKESKEIKNFNYYFKVVTGLPRLSFLLLLVCLSNCFYFSLNSS